MCALEISENVSENAFQANAINKLLLHQICIRFRLCYLLFQLFLLLVIVQSTPVHVYGRPYFLHVRRFERSSIKVSADSLFNLIRRSFETCSPIFLSLQLVSCLIFQKEQEVGDNFSVCVLNLPVV